MMTTGITNTYAAVLLCVAVAVECNIKRMDVRAIVDVQFGRFFFLLLLLLCFASFEKLNCAVRYCAALPVNDCMRGELVATAADVVMVVFWLLVVVVSNVPARQPNLFVLQCLCCYCDCCD